MLNILFERRPYLLGLFFSLLGFLYILIVTAHYNLGVEHDNVCYLEAARNIAAGNGYTMKSATGEFVLVTHWPPFYSIALAIASMVSGLDCLVVSRYLAALLFALTMLFANSLLNKFQFNSIFKIILNILLLTSLAFQEYLRLGSEPLFIVFLLSQCYLLIRYDESKNKLYLISASVISGLAILTRFAGVGFAGGIVIWLFLQNENLKTRISNIIKYCSAAFVIVCCWLYYSSLHAGSATDRSLVFHLLSPKHLKRLGGTLMHWLAPSGTFVIGSLVILLLASLVVRDFKKIKSLKLFSENKIKLLVCLIVVYLGFLLMSISFFDFSTTFDSRMLAPLFPLLIILAACVINKIEFKKHYLIPAMLMLLSSVYCFSKSGLSFFGNGENYNGKTWAHSEVIAEIKKYSANKNIYTNGIYAARFLLNKTDSLYSLPKTMSPNTQIKNQNYNQEIEAIKDSLKSGSAIIVYFDPIKMYFLPNKIFLEKEFEAFRFVKVKDGFLIY